MTTMKRLVRFARQLLARRAFWRRVRPQRRAPGNREIVLASLPVGLVATIAGIVSYSHIVALGLRTHQGSGDAHLLPFAVDFLIVAGSVILLAGYWLGWLCVAAGVAGTLFANLEFGLPYGWLSAVVSTWPAVAFTVATFVLERWLRSRRQQPAAAVTLPVMTHASGNGSNPARKAPVARMTPMTKQARAAAVIRDNPGITNDALAGLADCKPRTIQRARADMNGAAAT